MIAKSFVPLYYIFWHFNILNWLYGFENIFYFLNTSHYPFNYHKCRDMETCKRLNLVSPCCCCVPNLSLSLFLYRILLSRVQCWKNIIVLYIIPQHLAHSNASLKQVIFWMKFCWNLHADRNKIWCFLEALNYLVWDVISNNCIEGLC